MHGRGLGFHWAMNSVVFCLFWALLLIPSLRAVEPVILKVQAEQLPGTRWVDIAYEVQDPDSAFVTVYLKVSANGGATWDVPATSAQGAVGRGIKAGEIQHIRWDSSVDYPHRYSKNLRFKVGVTDWVPPVGMNLIQEGSFEMACPPHTVTVSEFAMDVY